LAAFLAFVLAACGNGGEHAASGEDEESGRQYGLDETYDETRAGARLVLAYDAPMNAFSGTVENGTNDMLDGVRVEVHLSNGVELGPTTAQDLEAGEVIEVTLAATDEDFETWSAHPEVGGESDEHGSESSEGEHDGAESDGD